MAWLRGAGNQREFTGKYPETSLPKENHVPLSLFSQLTPLPSTMAQKHVAPIVEHRRIDHATPSLFLDLAPTVDYAWLGHEFIRFAVIYITPFLQLQRNCELGRAQL
jgi:hypothetical protein